MPYRPSFETILDLIRDEAWDRVSPLLAELHPADVADIIDRAPSELQKQVFALLTTDVRPDVLAELESRAGSEVLESLTSEQISEIVEDMAPDDAADVLAELPAERSQDVLALMEASESREVRKLLQYDEDSAGGIMTPDVAAVPETATVAEALDVVSNVEDDTRFYYAYVVDRKGCLTGYVDIWELLRTRDRSRPVHELMHREPVAAEVTMDQEQVARLMNQYDLSTVPVVDAAGRLLGRVTVDDVIDVMEEEASEDIFLLAGSDDAELESRSPFRSCLVRLPWLFVTLGGGFLTSLILKQYHAHIADLLVLASFVPIVLAMGGNTGIQSSTLIVRSIAVGGFEGRHSGRLLLREVATGAIMGLVCGIVIGVFARFVSAESAVEHALAPSLLGLVVALALFSAMTFAAVFGALVPIVLNRIRLDPAVASGPFITITNDIAALLIYFGVTLLLIGQLAG